MNLHMHFGSRQKAKFTDAFEHDFFAFAKRLLDPASSGPWRNCSITGLQATLYRRTSFRKVAGKLCNGAETWSQWHVVESLVVFPQPQLMWKISVAPTSTRYGSLQQPYGHIVASRRWCFEAHSPFYYVPCLLANSNISYWNPSFAAKTKLPLVFCRRGLRLCR